MLNGIARRIKIVQPSDLREGHDISDWFDYGHTLRELERLARATADWVPGAQADTEPAPEQSEDAVQIERLAAVDDFAYDRDLGPTAKRLGIGKRTLDRAVKKKRAEMHAPAPVVEMSEEEQEQLVAEMLAEAKTAAKRLLNHPNILGEVVKQCRAMGVVGETDLLQLSDLVTTSRLLKHPVSLIIKGPSSAGKSFVILSVLRLFPDEAYLYRSSLSQHSLIYTSESLEHRVLFIAEAAAIIHDEFQMSTFRILVSENRLVHEVVERIDGRQETRVIEKLGPTALVMTTTAIAIEPETETRLISFTANDTPEQTQAMMEKQGELAHITPPEPDLTEWLAYQTCLSYQPNLVDIPYGRILGRLAKPAAVRMRRDHNKMLDLIRVHALLHQGQRERNVQGMIIATLEDYNHVRHLIGNLVSHTAGVSVPKWARETREAVAELLHGNTIKSVTVTQIAKALKIDRSTAWRRVQYGLDREFLRNVEEVKSGKTARIELGDRIPEQSNVFPTVKEIQAKMAEVEIAGEVSLGANADGYVDDIDVDRDIDADENA